MSLFAAAVSHLDIQDLLPRLRAADRAECQAQTGAPPELVLPQAVETADGSLGVFSIDRPGPLAILWVHSVPGSPEVGIVSMVASSAIKDYSTEFLRRGRDEILPALHERWPILANWVDERNTLHIRWLRWLGFSFLQRIEAWGAESRPFLEFARLRPCA